ncbi:MAG: tail fiber domain-containing protein [Chitinophagales bacterium]
MGIGTNDPTTRLDINGQIRVRGGAPSLGKVLTSDANGLATWQDIPAVETGTLNQAYNAGGSGAGREIIADSGAVLINGNDGILVTGTLGEGKDLEDIGSSTSMFFYPKKAAFRAGEGGIQWSDENIGNHSVGMGYSTVAKGNSSFAMGAGSQANADYSTALGNAQANGYASVAMGFLTQSNGIATTAFGNRTKANGFSATAMGYENIANGNSSLVIGRYNDTIVSTQPAITDFTPLFIIGNGTGVNARSNAMVVQQDAKAGVATSSPKAQLHIAGNDGLLVTGTYGQGQDLDISGAGTRMFFYPKKAAFRAGNVFNNNWNVDSIGNYSFAVGFNTKAIGETAIAMGYGSSAMGTASTAMGEDARAHGDHTTAMGFQTKAFGEHSTALGNTTYALGYNSTSMGFSTAALGSQSTSMGYVTQAKGSMSVSMGNYTMANGYGSLVIGTYNDTIVAPQTALNNSTPLFVIGNGTSSILRKNAMVVQGDARTGIATSSPLAQLHVAGNDGLLVTGTHGSGESVTIAGAGSRMFFNPRKSAFRVGYVDGNNWNVDSIGDYSTAMGWNAKALGARSFSAGDNTLAQSYASVAMGASTEARFTAATAFGRSTKAMGNSSTAMGNNTISNASSSLAVGYYNDPIVTQQTSSVPTATSPLFIVGNGTSDAVRTNALVVRKDARMGVSTSNPSAQLHVAGTDGLLVTGTYGSGAGIVDGAATRMYFNPKTGAFRAGRTTNDSWDAANVGNYSFAAGLNSKAKYGISTAIGADVEALSAYEIALGRYNTIYTPANANDWDGADRLLVIGNGTSSAARSDAFSILKNGRVGLKTATPETDLHIVQSGTLTAGILLQQALDKKWRLYAATSVGGTNILYYEFNGINKAGINGSNGDYTAFSDIRLKKDVTPLPSLLTKVMALNPVTFRYNDNPDDAQVTTGFIAQEVQAIFPDLVNVDGETGYLTLSKSNFGVVAIKAIQELKTALDTKSTEVDELKKMLLEQQEQMQKMMEIIEQLGE